MISHTCCNSSTYFNALVRMTQARLAGRWKASTD